MRGLIPLPLTSLLSLVVGVVVQTTVVEEVLGVIENLLPRL
jgi:hypothetical protein